MCKFNTILLVLSSFLIVNAMELELQINPDDSEDGLPSAVAKAVNEAYDLNKKGIELLEEKMFDQALSYFDEALKIIPEYSDAENNRGVVYYRKGNISQAQQIWKAVAKRDPDYAVASYNLGLTYVHDNQIEAAQRLFERAIKSDKQLVEPHIRLGYTYLQTGQKGKALEELRKAYKIAPKHPDAWSFLAHALIVNGDTTEALSILKKNENEIEALKMLGKIEAIRKNYSKASDYLAKAVTKGANPSLLVDLSSIQMESGNCKAAISTLKEYFNRSTSNASADAYLTAGISSKDCGDIETAQKYFDQGLKKYPTDAILRYNLGQIYFHQKNFDKADNVWDELSDTLQDPSLFYLRALSARRKNDFVAAEKFIQKAISIDERAEFYDFLGVIYHNRGDDKKAGELFRKALKIDPDLRSAQLNLALTSQSASDMAEAISALEKQLSSCNSDSCADIAFKLSVVYYHSKHIDKSVAVLSKLRDSDKDERIYRHLAIYYRELQDWKSAVITLETAVKKLVVEPQTEYELAETYLLSGAYNKAIERFNILLSKWKENPWRLYYQLGYSYLEQNEINKAKECFEKSIKAKSDNIAARGLLAFVLNRQGNVAQARELWEKNLRNDPSNASLLINMGLSYEKDGNYSAALDYYRKASIIKGNDPALQINIGNAYAGMGQFTDAISSYNQALSSSKRDCAAYNIFLAAGKKHDREKEQKMYELLKDEFSGSVYTKRVEANVMIDKGDTAHALSTLESISDLDAGDHFAIARIYALKGNREKTEKSLAQLPDDPQWKRLALTVHAQLSYQSKDYSGSLKFWHQSGDTTFSGLYNTALAAYKAKQFLEALHISQKIVSKASGQDRSDVCRLAGNACFELKQWTDARQWYLQLSSIDTKNAVVQYNCAVASYNLGEIDESWKYYERAKGLDFTIENKDIEARYAFSKGRTGKGGAGALVVVDSLDQWYNSAVDLQQAGKDTASELLYLKVVGQNPQHSQAWNNLGALYGARGEIDKAINAYQKAIDKRHDIPETYANLVNLYIELEQFKDARRWIILGIGHNPDSQILIDMKNKIAEAEQKKDKK